MVTTKALSADDLSDQQFEKTQVSSKEFDRDEVRPEFFWRTLRSRRFRPGVRPSQAPWKSAAKKGRTLNLEVRRERGFSPEKKRWAPRQKPIL